VPIPSWLRPDLERVDDGATTGRIDPHAAQLVSQRFILPFRVDKDEFRSLGILPKCDQFDGESLAAPSAGDNHHVRPLGTEAGRRLPAVDNHQAATAIAAHNDAGAVIDRGAYKGKCRHRLAGHMLMCRSDVVG